MHETVTPGPVIVPSQCPKCRSLEADHRKQGGFGGELLEMRWVREVWNAGRRREQTGYRPVRSGWR